jgi:hypothetical protein
MCICILLPQLHLASNSGTGYPGTGTNVPRQAQLLTCYSGTRVPGTVTRVGILIVLQNTGIMHTGYNYSYTTIVKLCAYAYAYPGMHALYAYAPCEMLETNCEILARYPVQDRNLPVRIYVGKYPGTGTIV